MRIILALLMYIGFAKNIIVPSIGFNYLQLLNSPYPMDLQATAIQTSYDRFIAVHQKRDKELIARDKIRFSPEYLRKVSEAELLMAEAEEMFDGLPDSSKELEEVKNVLKKYLSDAGLSHFENVKVKYRKSKHVDKDDLLRVLDGDLSLFVSIANVTQVALQNHAKGSAKEKELLECIKEEQIASDIELLPPEQDDKSR